LPQVYTAGGSTVITGTVSLALRNLTQIASEGVVNSASYTQGGRVSPGGWVAIFGDHLAEQQSIADSVPFANQLGGTRVLFGGESLPLLYVNSTQINAQVPYGLVPDTQHQLQVVFKQDQSEPVDVTVAQTQPAIFTTNQAGYGQGAIFWTNPANSYVLADTANPVPAGAVLEIYATGLGPVTRNVASGTVSPGDPPAEVQQTVSATIGGLPADIKFKGLTPGSVGLYQINTVVPTGIPPGSAVPIVISVGGQVSQPGVTIAVRN